MKNNIFAKSTLLLIVLMMSMPQMAFASRVWEDYDADYPFWKRLKYYPNNGDPYIEWQTVLFDDSGNDEGFYWDDKHDNGLGLYIVIGNDEKEQFIGYLACADGGYSRGLYVNGNKHGETYSPGSGYGGTWSFSYGNDKLNGHDCTWIIPRWYIPLEYRNSNITIHLKGKWWKWTTKHGSYDVNVSQGVAAPYTYNVKTIAWNDTYSVSPDGTVTIPYSLGSAACNTDNHTHIGTQINGCYNGTIGYKGTDDGSYSFKLSDIGMDFRSSFTIRPYHEYTHYRDKDVNDGIRNYTSFASTKTFEALPVPVITDYSFNMRESKIRLTWKINKYSRPGKFVIYRDGAKITTVDCKANQTNYSFEEANTANSTKFQYDTDVLYSIYYVENGWDVTTKKDMLSASCTVSTDRNLPIKQFMATSTDDRVVLTWVSDGYPKNWGNHFSIYVDNETEPICDITPHNMQTSFQWEHRTTSQHTSRVTTEEGQLYYTEEPLNGAVPHTYRVVAMIGETPFETATARHRSINKATQLYDLTASKGVYPDKVKLSWRVDQLNSTKLKTYIVTRHTAEQNNSDTVTVGQFDSNNDHLTFTDDNPSPGVLYTYTVYVQERNDSVLFESHIEDIGFAQTTGTISGRVTYGSSGMAVQGVDVEARKIDDGQSAAQLHSIRFSETSGELIWQYPSTQYANNIFNDKDFTIQIWINPEQLVKQDFVGLARGDSYAVYPTEKYINPRQEPVQRIKAMKSTRYYLGRESECTQNHDATFHAPHIQLDCLIDETTYNQLSASSRKYYYRYGTFKDTIWDTYYVTFYDTVPAWEVREVSSSWHLGMNDNHQLVLYGTSVDSINGEVPIIGTVYESEPVVTGVNQAFTFEGLTLKAGDYNHVTLSRHGDSISCYVIHYEGDKQIMESVTLPFSTTIKIKDAQSMTLGGFVGNVDDFRLWKKALSKDEILDNFDHQLIGTENGLETYWTFDEGLNSQFFDISRTGTTYHNHHGEIGVNAASSKNVPEQLALKSKTDKDGNYIIRGVPFSGQGTTYAVMPEYGTHSFNPSQQIRFVSNSALVHNGINFEDISSFSVTGTVYYNGTDYPVAGCNLYVDGELCTRNGDPITTDNDGAYIISVPIGKHVIEVKKDGHVFANNGRYDNNGAGVEFTSDRANLDFTDITLVNFTGRVVGGNIEGDKPVGFRLSENNIGKALITMVPLSTTYRLNVKEVIDGTVLKIEANDETVPVSSARPDTISSTSWRGAGEQCNTIFIRTDETTGEFSAFVPPIPYTISGIKIEWSNTNILDGEMAMDLSYANVEHQDSMVDTKGDKQYYAYHTMLRHTYHPDNASFVVKQNGHRDGSFGLKKYVIQDALGSLVLNDIYHINADTIEYTYGYPLFRTYDQYIFEIEGYEQFVNNDYGDSIVHKVPMANMLVTIDNALALDQSVYAVGNPEGKDPGSVVRMKSNQMMLDSLGKAVYYWQAGFPLIVEPYTRTINIYYGEAHKAWSGNPLTGIVLGDMPLGNNFVTRGVDDVDMILRDPPGSQSFATWESGTVSLTKTYSAVTLTHDTISENHIAVGPKFTLSSDLGGSLGGSIGGEFSGQWKDDWGYEHQWEWTAANTVTKSISTSEAVSTSANPEYDGADGDVFIGTSTNIIYGEVQKLALYRDPQDTAKAKIDLQNSYSLGVTFPTAFAYTQRHIINTLLPSLEALRNSFLIPDADTSAVTNEGSEPIYVTPLSRTHPKFGTDSTYKAIAPKDTTKTYIDTVHYYNSQIAMWKKILANNEKEKIEAFHSLGMAGNNRSFDAGSTYSYSYTVDNDSVSETTTYSNLIKTIWTDNDNHGSFELPIVSYEYSEVRHKGEINTTTGGEEIETYATFSYTLQDNDADDAISVDIYTNQGKYQSPIFRTRGGQTSNPYEGEELARYHEPENHHVIMESTMQVDKPQIDAEPRTMSSIPSGSFANYELKLQNLSEVGVERPYRLMMAENTNPNGAQLFVDGAPLTDGRIVRVPGGQQLSKLLQLKQSDLGILDYEHIGIVLASVGQSDPMSGMKIIADTVFINAYFVPSSSPVSMKLDKHTMNTSTGTDLVITMSDFDRTFYNLKAFRLQYKPQGGNWTTFHEYVLNEAYSSGTNSELLPTGLAQVQYTLAMAGMDDGNYDFRIVSVSTYGNTEVYLNSSEQTLIKDISRPRPLGQAQPSDGILDIGDEVSVTFNMPILNGALTNENFLVTGVLNGSPVEHQTALRTNAENIAAQTEAKINLSGKDFSLDAWMYIQSDGILLSHGIDKQKMVIATNEQGQMVISFGDIVYTSIPTVPRNKWVFFTMSCETQDSASLISASVAYDDEIKTLFAEVPVPLYHGNGPLAVGGAVGAIHEMLLWDEARDIATALAQRSVTKSPSTRHLIGYWKMNEGEGKTIRDYARNRHMTMPAETWYINNVNKAVTLDGTQHLTIYTADVAPMPDDDYAIEFWCKSGAQTDTAQLFQLGEVGMYLDINGQLHLASGANDQIVNGQIVNNTWHHIMLNVRRTGTAAVYIDGSRALTVSADKIGRFASDSLIVGVRRHFVNETDSTAAYYHYDRHFAGSFDEIRIWKTTIASDLLVSKRKLRLNGDEPGLSLYYPFEKKTLDEFHQVVTSETLEELTGNGIDAVMADSLFTDDAPALREKLTETNVAFAFTASDTKIVIDVRETPANIDGCTLNFTVKDIRSTNGNTSEPATWSAFVHRNELVWQDDELFVVKEGNENVTLSTAIINRSGKPQRWSLGDMPTSLIASSTSGMLDPLQKEIITFRVNETAPIGKHERTIYAMGNNGIPTPLTIHLTVTGDVPEWSVAHGDYESAMYVVAQLNFFGKISDDEDDIVAAFIGDECRGVAQPEYKERYDGYYLTMTIYGSNAKDGNKEVTFRAYDASSGLIYTLVTPTPTIAYDDWDIVGRYDNPVMLSVTDNIEQRTMLKQGWNWISLYVTASDMSPKTVLNEIADDVILIKGQTNSDGFLMRNTNGWIGRMDTLRNSKMYAVKMNADRELRLVGKSVSPLTCSINLLEKWNWIGYYEQKRLTVANALAPMDPHDGDIIRSQRNLSYFDDFEWVGSLLYMDSGTGYILYNTDQAKQFAYPGASVSAMPIHRSPFHAPASGFAPIDALTYPYNMVLVAQVLQAGEPLTNTEIGVFAADECRAVGQTDESGMMSLLIQGEDPVTLTFKKQSDDRLFEAKTTLQYETDAIVGTTDMPFIINFEQLQGIDNTNAKVSATKFFHNGILYILRGDKTYTATGQEVK